MIKGSGFGTKLTGPPLRYDNFENGVAGEILPRTESPSQGWDWFGIDQVTFSGEKCRYPGTQSVKQTYITDKGPGIVLSNKRIPGIIPATKELYVSGWFWFKMWDGLSLNVKFISMGTAGPEVPEGVTSWQSRVGGFPSNSAHHATLYDALSDDCTLLGTDGVHQYREESGMDFDDLQPQEAWHRVETFLRIGTQGYQDLYIDGVKIADVQGAFTSDNCSIGYLLLGHYFRLTDGIGEPKAIRYWDEIYVDVTHARVEIGDASNYNSSSHREIQIPIKWNDGSLEITLNQGSFQTLKDKYLFVIDADNNPSKGYLLNQLLLPTITKPSIVQNFKIVQ
ncbi:MAG: hypothetical protein D3917_15270 [Candidatus Electrothrix sp. AX5]|nr:hypothetical protein [Candidatus Electrothrix sp. AX5]